MHLVYLPPLPSKTTVFDFSFDDFIFFTRSNWKQWLSKIFFWGGGGRGEGAVNKVYCGLGENGEFKRDKLQMDILFKVARPSIFEGTLSIFESLILKEKWIFIIKTL